jgi:hypothetical protein
MSVHRSTAIPSRTAGACHRSSLVTTGPPRPPGHRLSQTRVRKVTRNRGQFPSEQAALKVLYLAVRNLEDYRGRKVGVRSSGWKQALQAFRIYFEGRIPTP